MASLLLYEIKKVTRKLGIPLLVFFLLIVLVVLIATGLIKGQGSKFTILVIVPLAFVSFLNVPFFSLIALAKDDFYGSVSIFERHISEQGIKRILAKLLTYFFYSFISLIFASLLLALVVKLGLYQEYISTFSGDDVITSLVGGNMVQKALKTAAEFGFAMIARISLVILIFQIHGAMKNRFKNASLFTFLILVVVILLMFYLNFHVVPFTFMGKFTILYDLGLLIISSIASAYLMDRQVDLV